MRNMVVRINNKDTEEERTIPLEQKSNGGIWQRKK